MRREVLPIVRFLPINDGGTASDSGGDGGDGGGGGFLPPTLTAVYTTTPFTAGGVNFGLVSSANVPGNYFMAVAGFGLATLTMIADGILNDFTLYFSPVVAVPPVGAAYGVSYLDSLGVWQTGYCVAI